MMMLKRINKIDFRHRVYKRMFNGLLFFVLLFAYGFFMTNNFVFLSLSLFIMILNIWVSYRESLIYIEAIVCDRDKVLISYSIKDSQMIDIEFELPNCEIEYFGNGIGLSSVFSPRLVFRKGGKVVLVQYVVGEWDKTIMNDTEKEIWKQKKEFRRT